MMEYKDYRAAIKYDTDSEVFHGVVVGTRDVIFFEATSVVELKKEFKFSIDDYIASCEERGERPDVPFSGDISLRGRTMTNEQEILDRITMRAGVLGGKPIIRDMRISVEHILGMLAAGDSVQVILDEYPFLEPEDIQACFLFAYRSLAGEQIHERVSS